MFKPIKLLIVILASLWATNGFANTNGESWVLSNVSGKVMLTKAGSKSKLAKLGDLFAPGDRLNTPLDGAAAVTRDAEAMIISGDSELELPVAGNTKAFTTVVQNKGTILFSAKKKANKHFEIKTPFAAALVKGTTFVISVGDEDSQIQVFEGVVGLKGIGRKLSYDITTGLKSFIPKDISKKIIISKVLNAPKFNPHLGSDIKKLIETYLGEIKLLNQEKQVFKLEIKIAKVEMKLKSKFAKKLAKLDIKTVLKKLRLEKVPEQKEKVIKAQKPKVIKKVAKVAKSSKAKKSK